MAKSTDSSTLTKTRKATQPTSKVTSKSQEPQTPRHAANAEEREHMIQTTAYHLAERDGFPSGREQDYWYQAEVQVDQLLRPSHAGETDQH